MKSALLLGGLLLTSGMASATENDSKIEHSLVAAEAVARQALDRPMPGLDPAQRPRFADGRSLFRQVWVVAPSRDTDIDGLGPLYNRPACSSCHPANGRGRAPDSPGERMREMLVRLSVPGAGDHGAPRPHPVYGDQLNETGIPGVPGESRAALHWQSSTFTFADGETVELRQPRLEFRELAYGPLDGVLTSPRVGPAMLGLGLLDAVATADLQAMAAQPGADGVQGRVNRVWNASSGRLEVGRFGFKSNNASLLDQIAAAMAGDLGLTSRAYPVQPCMPAQTACREAPAGGDPELSEAQLQAIAFYLAHLQPPARRDPDSPDVQRGERHFHALGCAACHRPQLRTAADAASPLLRDRLFEPYTDLLLHDMGEGLADGRPDHLAGPRDWRTAPLWGIGQVQAGNAAGFLHDGRARSLAEAILWHGGEAQAARDRYAALPRTARDDLHGFLGSL